MMAKVVITFEDVPGGEGKVDVEIEFLPEVKANEELTSAQALALQTLERAKELGE